MAAMIQFLFHEFFRSYQTCMSELVMSGIWDFYKKADSRIASREEFFTDNYHEPIIDQDVPIG